MIKGTIGTEAPHWAAGWAHVMLAQCWCDALDGDVDVGVTRALCLMSCVLCLMSYVLCLMSCVLRLVSCVLCLMSYVLSCLVSCLMSCLVPSLTS